MTYFLNWGIRVGNLETLSYITILPATATFKSLYLAVARFHGTYPKPQKANRYLLLLTNKLLLGYVDIHLTFQLCRLTLPPLIYYCRECVCKSLQILRNEIMEFHAKISTHLKLVFYSFSLW